MTSANPRRLPSGKVIWRVQFRVNGKVTSESFPTQHEADKFAKLVDRVGPEAAQQVRNARDERTKDVPTLREWADAYLDPSNGYLGGITPGTLSGYRQIADRSFLQVLGEIPLDLITKQQVAKWVHWQEAQPSSKYPGQNVSAKTVANYHGLLSSMLNSAAEAHIIDSNVAHKTRITPGMRQGVTFLTEQEVDRIIAAMNPYYGPLTYFLAWTGMRWGEATALTWADFDLNSEPATVRIDKAWKKGVGGKPVLGTTKTKKSRRTIPVSADVIELLGPPGPGNQLVFRGEQGGMLWSERFHKAAWGPAIRRVNSGPNPLGKQPRPHDLRHSHASWLIAEGTPLPHIQARLGHENITTTVDTYGHLLPDAKQQIIEIMARRRARTAVPAGVPRTEIEA